MTIKDRIINAAVEIRMEDASEIIFQHSIFAQVALPRSKPEGRVWERNFKNASVVVEAGRIFNGRKLVEQPLPYGTKPRLALIHINSEAVRTQCPQIEVGHSVAEFLRRMGLADQDGRTYQSFKKQMMALAASRLTIGFNKNGKAVTINTQPVSKFEAWLVNNDRQEALWPGELTLSTEYFESLIEHAVPLDLRAISALSHSALALDIYTFLARRLHEMERPVKVPFVSFQEQFGQEYSNYQNFKKKFLEAMKQVQAVYPAAKIQQVTGGLVLNPSHPPVKTIAKGHRIGREAIKALPSPNPTGNLTERTLERFRALWAGLDVYACKDDFDQWLSDKEQKPVDYNRAFFGFAKKWTKGKVC